MAADRAVQCFLLDGREVGTFHIAPEDGVYKTRALRDALAPRNDPLVRAQIEIYTKEGTECVQVTKAVLPDGSDDFWVGLPEQMEAKRRKGDAGQPLRTFPAAELVQEMCRAVDGTDMTDQDPCEPRTINFTWGLEKWAEELIDGRKELRGLDPTETRRAPRVLGLYAGTGSGKSHALRVAPQLLGCDRDVYITYNQDQDLSFDEANPGIAILLRVLLRLCGLSNPAIAKTFKIYNPEWLSGEALIPMIADRLKGVTHLFIGVDEIRKLVPEGGSNKAALRVTSALGILASALEEKKILCTCLVSSLTESAFKTSSDRPIFIVYLPKPGADAREAIQEKLLPGATDQQKAMIAASAGSHLRSVVVACFLLQDPNAPQPEVRVLFDKVKARMATHLTEDDRSAVRCFLSASVKYGDLEARKRNPEALMFVDSAGAIPPAIVCAAYFSEFTTHPAISIFRNSLFVDPAKQLEDCGMQYDRFRAREKLPVVPEDCEVRNPGSHHALMTTLLFDPLVAVTDVDQESLFAQSTGEGGRSVEVTSHVVDAHRYVLPSLQNHPLVDRACIATSWKTGGKCLVIYQDKINNNLAAAVHALNAAAKALQIKTKMPVLCVAQVIGASLDTRVQTEFEHPFVLVRSSEVKDFYTPTFAAAVNFVRDRHLKGQRHD